MNIKIKHLAITMAFLSGQLFSATAHSAGSPDDMNAGEMFFSAAASVAITGLVMSHDTSTLTDPSSSDEAMNASAARLISLAPGTEATVRRTIARTKAIQAQLAPVMPSLQSLANARSTSISHVLEIYRGITYDPRSRSLSIKCTRPEFIIHEAGRVTRQTAGFKSCQYYPVTEVSARYRAIVDIYAEENDIDLEDISILKIDLSDLYSNDDIPAHIRGILPIGGEEVVLTTNYTWVSNKDDILNFLRPRHKSLTSITPNIECLTLKENGTTVFSYDYSCTRRFCTYLGQTRVASWFRSLCGSRAHQA